MRLFVLAVFLAGCSPAPYAYSYSCWRVDSDVELTQAGVAQYFEAARVAMADHVQSESLCGTAIRVVSPETFPCDAHGMCTGTYSRHYGITLGGRGEALAHELFHAMDMRLGITWTGDHPQWTERGIVAAEFRFREAITDWRLTSQNPP